jgi:hypothetical protein
MYRVTREFITARAPFSLPYGVGHIPNVKRIGGGVIHECYDNAVRYIQENAKDHDIALWSGWLVQPYDKLTNSTLILAHWWNLHKSGQHIDTTPLSDKAEYIQDYSLRKFCVHNDGKLRTDMAHSLVYKDKIFFLIVDPEKNELIPISDLSNETLYQNKWL